MHIHFVTGRLAEHSLRRVVRQLAADADFDYSIDVLGITVAALMTPAWIARRLAPPVGATRVLIPGYCSGDLGPIEQAMGIPVQRGPRDLARLPDFFGRPPVPDDYGQYDIQIVAEINHCPERDLADILQEAGQLAAAGADLIDVGCQPGSSWQGVGQAVAAIRDLGLRVSVDSFDTREIERAVRAGAELVLSVNQSNRAAAADWGVEVVAIPDQPENLAGLDETVQWLAGRSVPFRIDPVLEPIGFGFGHSLGRYLEVRRRYPDAEMLMGIGNLTELTEVDSAGVNVLLLGFCQELAIHSVLTTQVIHWAQTSVRECDLARRLVFHACRHHVLPKHLEPRLIMLHGQEPVAPDRDELQRLAREIKDHNYRVFAAAGRVHLVSSGLHLEDTDPFRLFDELLRTQLDPAGPPRLDPQHAFYLGYEMCKAATALQLGKQYEQDEPLDWGLLTQTEKRHRLESPESRVQSQTASGGREPPDRSDPRLRVEGQTGERGA